MIDDGEEKRAEVGLTDQTACRPHELIERWWADHFPGSAVARDTAAWNAAYRAKEELKRLLAHAGSSSEASVANNHSQGST